MVTLRCLPARMETQGGGGGGGGNTYQFVFVGDVWGETKPRRVDQRLSHIQLRRMNVALLAVSSNSCKRALHFGISGDADVAFDVTPCFPPRQHVHERRLPSSAHPYQRCQHAWSEGPRDVAQQLQLALRHPVLLHCLQQGIPGTFGRTLSQTSVDRRR